MKLDTEIEAQKPDPTTAVKGRRPSFCSVAWFFFVWGALGGWAILGQWEPRLNVITKDQLTALCAAAYLLSKREPPNNQILP
jgi:hypothetical protein